MNRNKLEINTLCNIFYRDTWNTCQLLTADQCGVVHSRKETQVWAMQHVCSLPVSGTHRLEDTCRLSWDQLWLKSSVGFTWEGVMGGGMTAPQQTKSGQSLKRTTSTRTFDVWSKLGLQSLMANYEFIRPVQKTSMRFVQLSENSEPISPDSLPS